MDYAQMLGMQGGNTEAARIGDLSLNGNVGAYLLGGTPQAGRPSSQIPSSAGFGASGFDMNALLQQAQGQVQPITAAPASTTWNQATLYPAPTSVPTSVPTPVTAPIQESSSLAPMQTFQQQSQNFASAAGLPMPASAPVSPYASPAAQMVATPSYSDVMFGTSPRSAGTGYYDPLRPSWNQGSQVRASTFYDPLRGY